MKRILYGLSFIITLLPFSAMAQDATPLSLDDAINYALKHNVNAKNAQLDILLQKAKNAEITAAALPRINGKGEFIDYVNPIQTFVPGGFIPGTALGTFTPVQFTPKYSNTASISGSQLIFDGSVFVALQARNTVIKLFEESARVTEEDVRYNTQKAYYSIVIARRQFNNLKRSMGFIRSMSNDMEVMKENGFVEKIEVDRTNVQLNNFLSDSIRVASLLEVSEQMLKMQIGMDITQPIVLIDTSFENEVSETLGLLSENADYINRPAFSLLNTQLKLNEYDLKRYRLAAIPSLATFANAQYNYATNEFSDLFDEQYVFGSLVGLTLNIPIFNGFQRVNQVKQSKINIEKTRNNIQNLKLAIDFQTESAKTALRNSALMLKNEERNMELAESVLDLAQKKYKAGVGSNLEVSTAQTELLKAQSNYFQSLLTVMNSQADLQKALGLLSKN